MWQWCTHLLALLVHLSEQLVGGAVALQPLHLVSVRQAQHQLHGHLTRQQQALAQLLGAQGNAAGQGPQQPGVGAQGPA